MAKSSYKQIRQDTLNIIAELQKNCNASIDKISKNLGFSRQKVWRIIKNLDSNQFIWGYRAVPDLEKTDRKFYLLLIRWNHMPVENEFEEALVKRTIDKEGEKIGVIIEDDLWVNGGEIDEVITFTAPGMATAKQFQELLLTTYTGNISQVTMLEAFLPLKRSGFLNPYIKQKKSLS